jgi:hypothetical protein
MRASKESRKRYHLLANMVANAGGNLKDVTKTTGI